MTRTQTRPVMWIRVTAAGVDQAAALRIIMTVLLMMKVMIGSRLIGI